MPTDAQLRHVAAALAGGPEAYDDSGPEIRDQYDRLAERAIHACRTMHLRPSRVGEPVPEDNVRLAVAMSVSAHRGKLTIRKADDGAVRSIAASILEQARLSGWTITYAREEAPLHSTHGPRKASGPPPTDQPPRA